jgi:hypothetical protein
MFVSYNWFYIIKEIKMKTNQIFSLITLFLAIGTIIFRVLQFPTGGLFILITMLMLMISTVLSYRENKNNGLSNSKNLILTLILLFLIISTIVNIFPFSIATFFRLIGIFILLFLPFFYLTQNNGEKISNSYKVNLLIYLFVVVSILTIK